MTAIEYQLWGAIDAEAVAARVAARLAARLAAREAAMAARAARAAELKTQADWWRVQVNPFEEAGK